MRTPPPAGLTVMASRSHASPELESYLSAFTVAERLGRGSSIKLCAIAAGEADLYPRHGPTCEWDIAAGHAVLLAAGGHLAQIADGAAFIYGKAATKFLNPGFVAWGDFRLPDTGRP